MPRSKTECVSGLQGSSSGEREFANEPRRLIKIAVAQPVWFYVKVHDAWPALSRGSVRPDLVVDLLVASKLCSVEFAGEAFVLHGLFTFPANNEGTGWIGDQICILSRSFDCVEDEFQIGCNSDADQSRLR